MDESLLHHIESHITKHLGPPDEVLHELIPSDVHIDIHIVKPSAKRPFYTLVTSGMAEHPMTLPEGLSPKDVTPYVELMLCLPPDWKINDRGDHWNWPIKWMNFLGKYPHEFGTWLYVGHTVPNDDPPEPFGPGTKLCCWFLHLPRTVPEKFMELKLSKQRTILFLAMSPIYKSEMEFALSDDAEGRFKLDQALASAGVTELIDLTRKAVKQVAHATQ